MPNVESRLTLRRAIWNRDLRRSILNRGLTEEAKNLETKLKDNIDNSTPAGRLYNVGRITARRSSRNSNLPRARGTTTRVYVAPVLHQASAPGQPPARLTDTLYRGITVRRDTSKWAIIALSNAPYSSILDDLNALSRPFFRTIIEAYRSSDFVDGVRSIAKQWLARQS